MNLDFCARECYLECSRDFIIGQAVGPEQKRFTVFGRQQLHSAHDRVDLVSLFGAVVMPLRTIRNLLVQLDLYFSLAPALKKDIPRAGEQIALYRGRLNAIPCCESTRKGLGRDLFGIMRISRQPKGEAVDIRCIALIQDVELGHVLAVQP